MCAVTDLWITGSNPENLFKSLLLDIKVGRLTLIGDLL